MSYEQKYPTSDLEINADLELLKLRLDEISKFNREEIASGQNKNLNMLFEKEPQLMSDLFVIDELLENTTVKINMINQGDYSDIAGNFYGTVFLFLRNTANGKKYQDQSKILELAKTKTKEFLGYLEEMKGDERGKKAA